MKLWTWPEREKLRREIGCTYRQLEDEPGEDIITLAIAMQERTENELANRTSTAEWDSEVNERYRRLGIRR